MHRSALYGCISECRFVLDSLHAGEDLELLNAALSVTIHNDGKWRTVRGTVPVRRGHHFWDVKLDSCSSGRCLCYAYVWVLTHARTHVPMYHLTRTIVTRTACGRGQATYSSASAERARR